MPLGNTSNTAAQRRKARLLRAMTLLAMGMTPVATWAQTSADTQSLDTVTVTGTIPTYGDTPPPAFAGGQIAAGAAWA